MRKTPLSIAFGTKCPVLGLVAGKPLGEPDGGRKALVKKSLGRVSEALKWVQGRDLNPRPSGYEGDVWVGMTLEVDHAVSLR